MTKNKTTSSNMGAGDTQAIRDLFLKDHPGDKINPAPAIWLVRVFTALSFLGTFIGLRLIVRSGDVVGGFWGGLLTDLILTVLVLAATGGMVYFLRLFVSAPFKRCLSLLVYLPLLLFSVMFGFAFYWQRIEAPKQSTSMAQEKLQGYIETIDIATANLIATQENLNLLSRKFSDLAKQEKKTGGTCGRYSPPGTGPRERHRDRRAAEIADEVERIDVVTRKIEPKLDKLRAYMPQIRQLINDREDGLSATGQIGNNEASRAESSVEKRERIFNEARQLALDVNREINAIASNSIIASSSVTFGQWASEYDNLTLVRSDDPRGTPYICSSPSAATGLRTASHALSNLPSLRVPRLPSFGGAAGTSEAISRFLGSLSVGFRNADRETKAEKRVKYDSDANTSNLNSGDESAARTDASRSMKTGTLGTNSAIPEQVSIEAEARSRLVPADYFPFFIAFLVDFLLFASAIAERGTRSRTEKARTQIREAVGETINPLHVPLLRASIKEEEAWKILSPYRFSIDFEDFFVALPTLSDDDAIQIRDTLKAWIRLGMAHRFPMRLDELKKRLKENNNTFLLEKIAVVETRLANDLFNPLVVQLTAEADTLALLSTIFKGIAPGPRDNEPLSESKRQRGVWMSMKNIVRACASAVDRKLNGFADRLEGKDYSQTKTQEEFRRDVPPQD